MRVTNNLPAFRLDSFDAVVKHYASIVPLKGKYKQDDVRPIHPYRRDRKHERIIKHEDGVYLLADYEGVRCAAKEQYVQLCPIVWERNLMGDFITIRTAINWASPSRYRFLGKFLPNAIKYKYTQAGRHWLEIDGEKFHITKCSAVYDWNTKTVSQIEDQHIKFKVEGNKFTRVSDLLPYPSKRKDPEMKVFYDPLIQSYWEWMNIMLPVLGNIDTDKRITYAEMLKVQLWYFPKGMEHTDVRKILEDADDNRRVAFATLCATHIEAIDTIHNSNRFNPNKDSYNKFRDLMYRVGKLYTKVYK